MNFRPVVTAAVGTPCGWTAYGETGKRLTCQGGKDAIHVLTVTLPVAVKGTALCGYHSPWDPTDAEREAVNQPLQSKAEAGAARLAAEAEAEAEATAAEVNEGCRELAAQERAIRTPGTVLVDMTDGYSVKVARVENAGAADELVIFTNGESLFFDRLIVMVRTERMRIDSIPAVKGHGHEGHEINLSGTHRGNKFCVTCQVSILHPVDRAKLDEDQASASVPIQALVVGPEATRRIAEHTRLMAYQVAARYRGKMQLTRVFTATVKGFNADYGQECRTWAQVEKLVAGLIAQHRGARS